MVNLTVIICQLLYSLRFCVVDWLPLYDVQLIAASSRLGSANYPANPVPSISIITN